YIIDYFHILINKNITFRFDATLKSNRLFAIAHFYSMASKSGIMGWLVSYIVLVCSCINSVSTEWNTKDYLKKEHSLIKPYQGAGLQIPYWNIVGTTVVTNNYIRLTHDVQSKLGAVWNAVPCRVRNWEMQIQFKVHGGGKDHLFGDGMAIWYVKERSQMGDVFGSKDLFHGLALFLDTYSNHNGPHNHAHPYISAMINNGTLHYDHDRDGTHTELAGCESKFRNLNHDSYISIRYERDTLTVLTDIENKAAWKECFSVKGVYLPTGYYFGVSAATGELTDNHDVINIKLYELDVDPEVQTEDRSNIVPSASFFAPPRDHVDDPKVPPMSGLKLFAIVLCALIGVIVCVVVGIIVFQKQQETSRKRILDFKIQYFIY
uniref:L-type lectin-like domain-containing protein n=1 Tax=Strigamia maritima TaxID=126957 RepID=T1ISH8_STRMM